jgi:hypothetical protein
MLQKTTNKGAHSLATGEPSHAVNPGLYAQLRAADNACGPEANKNDRADALIVACLCEGLATAGQIIAVITGFGFDLGRGHIGARLTNGAGRSSKSSLWRKTGPNTYALFDPDEPAPAAVSAANITVPKAKPD